MKIRIYVDLLDDNDNCIDQYTYRSKMDDPAEIHQHLLATSGIITMARTERTDKA